MNGPVLAALGHLLSKYLGKLIIPSSNYFEPNMKWGSHWLTDTFFSSASMQIIHTKESDAIIRPDKTALIAQYPIVQKSLRVCWKKTQLWNCSQCEKCIRTMIDLCSCNALENFNEVFDLSIPLVKRIDGINKTNDNEIHFLKESLRRSVPLDIKDAILNLIARSAKKTKLMHHFS